MFRATPSRVDVFADRERALGTIDPFDREMYVGLGCALEKDIQDHGVEVDIWKIEGVDAREDAEMLAEQTRSGEGREGVICVLLGRAARPTTRSTTGCARPRRSRASSASRSGARSGGTRSRLPRRQPRARGRGGEGRRQLPALRQGLRRRGVRGARLTRSAAAVALAAAALAGCSEDGSGPAGRLDGHVVAVSDGDTVRVRLDSGRVERVRYIGIDAPETPKPDAAGECFGQRAREANARLVGDRDVRLELDVEERDRYGRLLAYVYVEGTNVGAALVRDGYAVPLAVPPNLRHLPRFMRLARDARSAGRGLWASCVS